MMNRSITLSLAVCLFALAASSVHASESSVQSLSTDAAEALANAESNVNMAKKRSALWTTAVGALEKAREAAKKGDSAIVVSQSETAVEQAFLGMAQLGYPSTEQ